nr:integrase, catalytic region, zinc finger, CCHC-type, peptidase aspartic, catalytic [Tanacetum cinerariifolium]
MSRDVITIGSTMRIPLLYRVSLAGTAPNAPPTLKDPKFWTTEEKKTRKIDRLARSLLIQGLPNDIYSLIDSNNIVKDLWDALERQMHGSEYEWKLYGTLMRQTKNLMDININALYFILKQNQGDVNDAMGYKKKAVVVTSDPLASVAEKTKVTKRKEKGVVQSESEGSDDEDITSSLVNKKLEYVKSKEKKADEKKRDMRKVKCYNCKKEGHFAKDFKKAKVKDYNYYKIKMLLAKKDSDEQLLLAEDQAWMKSSSDSDQEISANMVFRAKIEKVNTFKEKNKEFNEQIKVLNEKNNDLFAQINVLQEQLKVKHVVIDTHTECQAQYAKLEEEIYQYMIRYSALCDNDTQHRKKIDEQEILFDKKSHQLVKMNNNVLRLQEKILEKETKISELEGCVRNKILEIEKYLERLNDFENKLHKIRKMHQTIHMIIPSKDTMYNGRKGIGFENPSYFCKAKELRPSLYDERVICLGNSKINKDVKRYSRKDLLSCNNSHHVDARSAYACNEAMNVSCNSRLYASYDVNDLFVFDDIIDSGCSKHMSGNRTLLTNFVEKFLGTVRFGNNDFAVIAGYGDVVIGSMTIKKVYYVEDDVDLLTRDRSLNLYTIALNDIALNSSACLLAKASLSQSWLWHQRLSYLNFATINNLVKNNLVRDQEKKGILECLLDIQKNLHESVNVNFNEISEIVFTQFSLEPGLSNLNETGKSSNPTVSQVLESSKKDLEELFHNFYDEYFDASKITKSLTTTVATSTEEISSSEEVFHESSESFQEKYSSSSLNADCYLKRLEYLLSKQQNRIPKHANHTRPNTQTNNKDGRKKMKKQKEILD